MASTKSSPIRFASDYAEAVDCFYRGMKSGSIIAARVNLTDTATPTYYRVKNHILLAALDEDSERLKSHIFVAKREMNILTALVYNLKRGSTSYQKGEQMLTLLEHDIQEVDQIRKDIPESEENDRIPHNAHIIHDCVEPTRDGQGVMFRIPMGENEMRVRNCLDPERKTRSRLKQEIEALRDELNHVQKRQEPTQKALYRSDRQIKSLKHRLWAAMAALMIVSLGCVFLARELRAWEWLPIQI